MKKYKTKIKEYCTIVLSLFVLLFLTNIILQISGIPGSKLLIPDAGTISKYYFEGESSLSVKENWDYNFSFRIETNGFTTYKDLIQTSEPLIKPI